MVARKKGSIRSQHLRTDALSMSTSCNCRCLPLHRSDLTTKNDSVRVELELQVLAEPGRVVVHDCDTAAEHVSGSEGKIL